MLESVIRGRERTRRVRTTVSTARKGVEVSTKRNQDHLVDATERTQWTVKGIDKHTLELSRKAARKRGMKFGAWVNEVLRSAACDDGMPAAGGPRELLTKIAELEFKFEKSVGELKESTNNIQHDVRVLQLLVPKA